jgi:hypothetical protein
MRRIFLLLALTTFGFTSCISTLKVRQGEKDKRGIPFYAYKPVIQQQTKYVVKWVTLELRQRLQGREGAGTIIHTTRLDPSMDVLSIQAALSTLNKSGEGVDSDEFKALADKIRSAGKSDEDFTNDLLSNSECDTQNLRSTTSTGIYLVDNNWKYSKVVDYSHPYHLNARSPLLGNTEFTQELAPNGTLTKATATVDSQIDEVLGVFAGLATPLASVKVAEIENSSAVEGATADGSLKYTYTIDLKEEGWLYIFTRQYDVPVDGKTKKAEKNSVSDSNITGDQTTATLANEPETPIPFCLEKGNYTRLAWPTPTSKPDAEAAKKPTIAVSGNITLPSMDH